MAKLELPVRAFVEDHFRRSFPDYDASRGSAVSDLVIKAQALLLQPLRHEIDSIKVNQSVSNWQFMTRSDLDRLAANWGKFRENGSRAAGTVRLYFAEALNYQLDNLTLFSTDGSEFQLAASVRINSQELLKNQSGDQTFFMDVEVVSKGVGSRYAVAAGQLTGIQNAPQGLIRVENLNDFEITAPDETNFDVVNAMYRNLSMRNLVSAAAIRSPVLNLFPGVLDILVAGPNHPKMVRDLTDLTVAGNEVTLHRGGMADVWLNTLSLATKTVNFSYLPASGRVRLVSAEQAAETTTIYEFSTAFLTAEGRYIDPTSLSTLDESAGVVFDEGGFARAAFVAGSDPQGLYALVAKDILSGDRMFALPSASATHTFVDVLSGDFSVAGVAAGDNLRIGSVLQHVTATSGLVLQQSPPSTTDTGISLTYSNGSGAYTILPGDREINLTGVGVTGLRQNDRLTIPKSEAAGQYRVLKVNANKFYVGNILARATIVSADPPVTAQEAYTLILEGPGAAALEIPANFASRGYVYFGGDDASDYGYAADTEWARITRIVRGLTTTTVDVLFDDAPGAAPAAASSVYLVEGLGGDMPNDQIMYVERDSTAFEADGVNTTFADTTTLYSSVVAAVLPVATTRLAAIGIAASGGVAPGDVVLFEVGAGTIPEALIPATGGSGEWFSVLVEAVDGPDAVYFRPALPFELQPGVRYSVVRNRLPTGWPAAVNTTVAGNDVTLSGWELGLGSGIGLMARATAPNVLGTLPITTLAADGPYVRVTITGSVLSCLPGDAVTISGGTVEPAMNGSHSVVSVISATVFRVLRPVSVTTFGAADGSVAVDQTRFYQIAKSTGIMQRTLRFKAQRNAIIITMSGTAYASVSAEVVARRPTVTQTIGTDTFGGVLVAVNNVTRQWTIVPNAVTVDLFGLYTAPGEELRVVGEWINVRPSTGPAYPTTPVDYFEPLIGDLGKTVRQGSYTATLVSFSGGTTDPVWAIAPSTEFDTFDNVTAPTYVDVNANGVPVLNQGYGVLATPGTAVTVSTGSNVVQLERTPHFPTGTANFRVYPRFGYAGGFFDGSLFNVNADVSLNAASVFTSIVADDDVSLVVPQGSNTGEIQISAHATSTLTPQTTLTPEVMRPTHGSPPAAFANTHNAADTTLNETGIGIYGLPGRVVRVVAANLTYYFRIVSTTTQDAVVVSPAMPVTFTGGAGITWEIVEAFFTPYYVVNKTAFKAYRVYQAPQVGETLGLGETGSGSVTTLGAFSDGTKSFTSVFGNGDYDTDTVDLQLFIDSGPNAAVDGRLVLAQTSDTSVDLSFTPALTTSNEISYHVVYRPRGYEQERWITALVLSATELLLDVPDNWEFARYNTYRAWQLDVASQVSDTAFFVPAVQVSGYVYTTKTLTIGATDVINDPASDVSGKFASNSGFDASLIGTKVLVMPRMVDRTVARNISGLAAQTYNYYLNGFMSLPVVRILLVERLDPTGTTAEASVPFNLSVVDQGLRYASDEINDLVVTDSDSIGQPLRVTYVTDSLIASVDSFLNDPLTRVVNSSLRAKRMETIIVNVSVTVRTEKTAAEVTSAIASYIARIKSSQPITKAGLVQYLYTSVGVTYLDTDLLTLSGTYDRIDGVTEEWSGSTFYGSDVACYLAGDVSVTKL